MAEEELKAFTGDELWEPWLEKFQNEVAGHKKRYKHAHLCSLIKGEAAEFVFLELPSPKRENYQQLIQALTEQYGCANTESDDTLNSDPETTCFTSSPEVQRMKCMRDDSPYYQNEASSEEDWLQYAFHHMQLLMMEMEELRQEVYHNRNEIQYLKQELSTSNNTIDQMKQVMCQEKIPFPPSSNVPREKPHKQCTATSCVKNIKPGERNNEHEDLSLFIPCTTLPDLIDGGDTDNDVHTVNVCKQIAAGNSSILSEEPEILSDDEFSQRDRCQGNLLGPSHEEVVRWPTSGNLLALCVISVMLLNYIF